MKVRDMGIYGCRYQITLVLKRTSCLTSALSKRHEHRKPSMMTTNQRKAGVKIRCRTVSIALTGA